MATGRDKLVAQFRGLVGERLARVSRALMTLEGGPDAEAGKQTLRELHGLKGEARMMGFADINGNRQDISGAPVNFSESSWVSGGAIVIGGTYFFDPQWFVAEFYKNFL